MCGQTATASSFKYPQLILRQIRGPLEYLPMPPSIGVLILVV